MNIIVQMFHDRASNRGRTPCASRRGRSPRASRGGRLPELRYSTVLQIAVEELSKCAGSGIARLPELRKPKYTRRNLEIAVKAKPPSR